MSLPTANPQARKSNASLPAPLVLLFFLYSHSLLQHRQTLLDGNKHCLQDYLIHGRKYFASK